ncbi:hypothetical protein A2954_01160 [Candidatus Roizmanbacteria bacterium RIFCSPLOWO2_01_FULL_37_12]|uniref:PIN domain-containing protein n=1 Tax=Candidatus Roizmanbacteria bacterium RIFCSPLOWO2_01_FULL_37_12 TaxID=1802056 RepID=A0A1F7IGE8_9BACT|nr:MAG: hypothetical protein A3D76_01690 [Candidatus Roizmanbacteria bacterium RIFCSPHIGHO2_02_FULL_37_9b]OGK42434.1 MAG: hypothetical protein A2954_01160 [Candidatus Roizmanbacteria bacterium RIFCSPLOWO2_01_FULL_37_12]
MKRENSHDSSKKKYVLDSFALIALAKHETDFAKVEYLLAQAKQGNIRLYINIINLGEVFYTLIQDKKEAAPKLISATEHLPMRIIGIDIFLLKEAAKIKAKGGISYADAFVIATALKHDAIIVTGDKEFKKFEKLVKIEWLLTNSK